MTTSDALMILEDPDCCTPEQHAEALETIRRELDSRPRRLKGREITEPGWYWHCDTGWISKITDTDHVERSGWPDDTFIGPLPTVEG